MAATILIVEDDPAIRELLIVNLEASAHRVIEAGSAEEAEQLIVHNLPDLILLDWMLPGRSGPQFAQRIRMVERTKDVPIIMLTARTDEQDRVTGLEIGADDYMVKPFSPRELIARIKAVLRRRKPQLTEDKVDVNGLVLDPVTHRVTAAGAAVNIGPTEFRLLHFFMTHPERVHSRSQLLDKVWGDHVFVEERTVDVHIRRLRSVLEVTGHDSLIQTVRGSGYRFSINTE
ncbi:MAG: phosphate regulon transcriptional regulatory protein PhoB [Rhodocyclaceae bacterium]|nr:phosphate regulon transcriptional regulatory protein PhoB [Rhodocyclaceae bacterium]